MYTPKKEQTVGHPKVPENPKNILTSSLKPEIWSSNTYKFHPLFSVSPFTTVRFLLGSMCCWVVGVFFGEFVSSVVTGCRSCHHCKKTWQDGRGEGKVDESDSPLGMPKHRGEGTWMISSQLVVSKWSVINPPSPFISHFYPFFKGHLEGVPQRYLGGRTRSPWSWTTYKFFGMILQVAGC